MEFDVSPRIDPIPRPIDSPYFQEFGIPIRRIGIMEICKQKKYHTIENIIIVIDFCLIQKKKYHYF